MAAVLAALMTCSAFTPAVAVKADDDVVKLKIWVFGEGSTEECEKVSEALSEITREKIGAEVEIYQTIDTEKLNLAMTSGEKLDLVCAHNLDRSGLVSSGMLLPLDDLYTEYAPDAAAMVKEEDTKALYFDDQMYFLPSNGDKARASGVMMRKDILDELGINADDIKGMDDFHDVLVKVKENYPDLYPLVPSWVGGGMQKTFHIDDIYNGLVVLENGFDPSDTTITSQYETQEWKDFCNYMYQWNQEGLLMPDAATSTDNSPMSTVGFADHSSQLTQCLGHQSCLQTHMAVSHIPIDLRLRYQCSYGVHYNDINSSGTHHGLGDLQCLLSVIRLGNVQIINIHSDILRIDGIQGMLCIDKSGNASPLLYFSDHM